MLIPAYAKINLYLAVGDKRPDGYHNIESVMQTVSLADTVTVEAVPSAVTDISLSITDPALPTGAGNIAYRAAELFLSRVNVTADVRIHIEKNIPVAGGLAGGSTDGAAVLSGLNSIFGAPLTDDELLRIGARIGADVPFCLHGGTASTLGIGEIISPLPTPPDCTILIVRPHETVITAEAYKKIDMLPPRHTPPLSAMTDALARGSLDDIAAAAYNVFEDVMPASSEIFRIKDVLSEHGAVLSMMSGSGPSVFGIFKDADSAGQASEHLARAGYLSVLTAPVNPR